MHEVPYNGVAGFQPWHGGAIELRTGFGKAFPEDTVILAIGVKPDSALARAAGFVICRCGGIRVDSHTRRARLPIMQIPAGSQDVPGAHLKRESAWASRSDVLAAEGGQRRVRVRSYVEKTGNAFAAVRCRDRGFWLGNNGRQTKRAHAAVMFVLTLRESGNPETLPLITSPAQWRCFLNGMTDRQVGRVAYA